MNSCVSPCRFRKSVLVLITGCAARGVFQGQRIESHSSDEAVRSKAAWGDGRLMRHEDLDRIAARRNQPENKMISQSGMVTTAQPSLQVNDGSKLASALSQPIMERVPQMPREDLPQAVASDSFNKDTYLKKRAMREMAETGSKEEARIRSQLDSRMYGHKKRKLYQEKKNKTSDALHSANSSNSTAGNTGGTADLEGVCYQKVQGIKDELRQSGFDHELDKDQANPWGVLKFVAMQAKMQSMDRKGFTICQTGFNYGVSAAAFLCLVPHSKVISWDLGTQEFLEKALGIVRDRFHKRHTYIKGNSTFTLREAVNKALIGKQNRCDFVFIDGGHDERTMTNDITYFAKLSSVGAAVVLNGCTKSQTAWARGTELGVFEEAINKGLLKEDEELTKSFPTEMSGVCGGRVL